MSAWRLVRVVNAVEIRLASRFESEVVGMV